VLLRFSDTVSIQFALGQFVLGQFGADNSARTIRRGQFGARTLRRQECIINFRKTFSFHFTNILFINPASILAVNFKNRICNPLCNSKKEADSLMQFYTITKLYKIYFKADNVVLMKAIIIDETILLKRKCD